MVVDELLSALLQVVAFASIPFLFYLIKSKTIRGFMKYVGFYKPEKKTVLYAVIGSLLLFVLMWGVFFLFGSFEVLTSGATVTGKLKQAGLKSQTVFSLLLIALVKTSLSEEILFRGFIGKRLINRFGFQTGNILQSICFGIVHGFIFLVVSKGNVSNGIIYLLVILISLAGYVIGFIKERLGNGSIVPGWIAHGLGNCVGYFIIAFVL